MDAPTSDPVAPFALCDALFEKRAGEQEGSEEKGSDDF